MKTPLCAAFEADCPGYRAIPTARGTVALYLALRSIERLRGPGEVIVPATVCPSVPVTIALAGFTPRFCDVELGTFCMTEQTVREAVGERTRAIVAVHLFGKAVDVGALSLLASSRGLSLVEDVAQAAGGRFHARALGTVGDYSIFSFNPSKVITGSGGILLVRDSGWATQDTAAIEEDLAALPARPTEARFAELSTSFRNLTHGAFDLLRSGDLSEDLPLLPSVVEPFRALYLHGSQGAGGAAETLESYRHLARDKALRKRHYDMWIAGLPRWLEPVRFRDEENCWRLPLLASSHDEQLAILRLLRSAGHLVSNHYFPVSLLFGERSCLQAHQIGLRALNVWVDSLVDPERISGICSLLAAWRA